jgi:exodeoxyribonuclease V beta subunit
MSAVVRYPRPAILAEIPIDRPTVIEASAGTGKTFTLEHLVIELLLRGGAGIESILIVTFTEKATREMRQRIRHKVAEIVGARAGDACLAGPGESAWEVDDAARARLVEAWRRFDRAPISTIHGFCQRVLAEHAFHSGGLFAQELVDAERLFERSLREEVRHALAEGGSLAAAVRACFGGQNVANVEASLSSWARERGRLMPAESDGEPFSELVHVLVPRVKRRMAEHKGRTGQLDFDDMLSRLRDALAGPGGDALVRRLRATYRYCLVDEFQDTDELQWEIFRRLFFESEEGHVLFAIGDPKQAIYTFRGADVHTYQRARDAMQARGRRVALRDNFRSTALAVEAQNLLFGAGFFEGSIQYEPVRCGRPEVTLVGNDGQAAPPVVLVGVHGRQKLRVQPVRDAFYGFIAEECGRLVEDGALRLGPEGAPKALQWSDIHVLTRTRSESEQVGAALRRRGVPHAFFKQDGLFQTEEARHVRDVLAAVADPADRSLRLRAWLTPFFGVRLEDLQSLVQTDETHPLHARLYRLKALGDAHDYGGLFRALVEDTGVLRRELFLVESERALTNYVHLLELLLAEIHRRRRSVAELAAYLTSLIEQRALPNGEDGNVQRLESERQAVQILTMHKAKGLEAAVVFVAGGFTGAGGARNGEPLVCHPEGVREAWLGKPPKHVADALQEEGREEDERLLYVAVTRAKARLYLPYFGPPPDGSGGIVYQFPTLKGCYRLLNQRLCALVEASEVPPRLFGYVGRSVEAAAGEAEPARPGPGPWQPDATLVAPVAPHEVGSWDALRARHAAPIVTSYTQIKHAQGGYAAPEAEADAFTGESVDVVAAPEEQGLPGGSSVGVFLHEVLEVLPFEGVRDAASFDAWAAQESVVEVFRACARRNGVAPAHVPEAQRMVYAALEAPLRAGALALHGGLCTLTRRVPEMRFHYPLPERSHPRLGEPRPDPATLPFEVGRGFVRGVVDLVFEHEGRVYFLDYKSDRLPGYGPEVLARHVERNYALQARLYGLGVLRLLDLRDGEAYEARFGGLLYCFLRGMTSEGAGVYFERPSYAQACGWEQALWSDAREVRA